ncbi:MAG: type II secretion system protein [Thiobacillaceae bacterium]
MKPRQQGFTLIELAIVLVVLTVLAAGLLMPLSATIQIKRNEATQVTLEQARDALIGYAMAHTAVDPLTGNVRHYLPCPADSTGQELPRANLACPSQQGTFPWVTLGVGGSDAWGNRLYYAVDTNYSQPFSSTSTTNDNLQVCTAAGCPAGTLSANNLAALVTSRGQNGWGAISANSTYANAHTAPTSADELENTNKDSNFVMRPATQASATTTEFDDLVVWLPVSTLLARVCPAGGCP